MNYFFAEVLNFHLPLNNQNYSEINVLHFDFMMHYYINLFIYSFLFFLTDSFLIFII
jgi:hypothetical protein